MVAKSADLAYSPGLGLEPYRKEQVIPVKASAKNQLCDPEERTERGEREIFLMCSVLCKMNLI